jgi:hypothetical protein
MPGSAIDDPPPEPRRSGKRQILCKRQRLGAAFSPEGPRRLRNPYLISFHQVNG